MNAEYNGSYYNVLNGGVCNSNSAQEHAICKQGISP